MKTIKALNIVLKLKTNNELNKLKEKLEEIKRLDPKYFITKDDINTIWYFNSNGFKSEYESFTAKLKDIKINKENIKEYVWEWGWCEFGIEWVNNAKIDYETGIFTLNQKNLADYNIKPCPCDYDCECSFCSDYSEYNV